MSAAAATPSPRLPHAGRRRPRGVRSAIISPCIDRAA